MCSQTQEKHRHCEQVPKGLQAHRAGIMRGEMSKTDSTLIMWEILKKCIEHGIVLFAQIKILFA